MSVHYLPSYYDNWRLDNNEQDEMNTCSECRARVPYDLQTRCFLDDDGHELHIENICDDCIEYLSEQYPKGLQNEYIKSINYSYKGK